MKKSIKTENLFFIFRVISFLLGIPYIIGFFSSANPSQGIYVNILFSASGFSLCLLPLIPGHMLKHAIIRFIGCFIGILGFASLFLFTIGTIIEKDIPFNIILKIFALLVVFIMFFRCTPSAYAMSSKTNR